MTDLNHIARFLEIVYDGRSSNHDRRAATIQLETTKEDPDALGIGLLLAQDNHRPATARYYGLLCLEHAIKYRWESFSDEHCTQIQGWVLELAHAVDGQEPCFVRSKIGQLIEEIAERSWGILWLNFDAQLCDLWERGFEHKQIVLCVLETLSDRVFGKDEVASGLRGAELGRLCVDAFTPPTGTANGASDLRQDAPRTGWLLRLLAFLQQSLQLSDGNPTLRDSFLMTMSVLRSMMAWVVLKALAETSCIAILCHCIRLDDPQVNTVSRLMCPWSSLPSLVQSVLAYSTVRLFCDDMRQTYSSPTYFDCGIFMLTGSLDRLPWKSYTRYITGLHILRTISRAWSAHCLFAMACLC